MSEMGLALMGTGIASGENRAVEAAQKAISSPLLEDNSIQGARGVLINITGGSEMTLFEVNEASTMVQTEAHEDANIIFGTVIDDNMEDELRVTVIATGFDLRGKMKEMSSLAAHPYVGRSRREDLTVPTFMRDKEKKDSENPVVIKMGLINDDENIDFEVPAFLRRQAD
jgi:cell division protein FtsZ